MNDYSECDEVLNCIAYYRFKSSKSNLVYIVRIEIYREHVYGVKFFLKQMVNSSRKYSHLTNTFEPRTIVYSVFDLMLSIYHDDPLASFMFIGNPDENCSHNNTRRFRLYSRLVSNKISDRYFKHIDACKFSLYILANRLQMSDNPFFAEKLLEQFVSRFVIEEPENHSLEINLNNSDDYEP